MDLLQECATNYTKLLTSRYHIICGRSKAGQKERLAFDITFWQSDFYHLAGLHKLSDLPPFRRLRKPDTIAKILDGQLTESLARKSDYFPQIEDRLILLANLEAFLDSNDLVFRYDKKIRPRHHHRSQLSSAKPLSAAHRLPVSRPATRRQYPGL